MWSKKKVYLILLEFITVDVEVVGVVDIVVALLAVADHILSSCGQ